MRTYALTAALWLSSTTLLSAQSAPSSPEQILTQTPGADKYFRVQPDGAVTHTLSDFSCPADLPNLVLTELKIYNKAGTDVSCQYGRLNPETRQSDAYVTLYFYRYDGLTLDDNFNGAKASIRTLYPGAKYTGEMDLPEDIAATGMDIRTAKYDLVMHGRHFLSFLTLAEHEGWTIKTRVSTARDVLSPEGITMHVRDQMVPMEIMKRVIGEPAVVTQDRPAAQP